MRSSLRRAVVFILAVLFSVAIAPTLFGQTNSGSVTGTVTDPTGAVVPGATVTIQNPVSGYAQSAQTNASGAFHFANLPFNHYHVTAEAAGFGSVADDVNVDSSVPTVMKIVLKIQGSSSTVTVDAAICWRTTPPCILTWIENRLPNFPLRVNRRL